MPKPGIDVIPFSAERLVGASTLMASRDLFVLLYAIAAYTKPVAPSEVSKRFGADLKEVFQGCERLSNLGLLMRKGKSFICSELGREFLNFIEAAVENVELEAVSAASHGESISLELDAGSSLDLSSVASTNNGEATELLALSFVSANAALSRRSVQDEASTVRPDRTFSEAMEQPANAPSDYSHL